MFLWNSWTTPTIYQLTSYPSGDVHNPAISGNGGIVVFESSTDLLGTGAPGTVTELYEMDLNQTCPQCVPIPPAKPTGLAPVTKITTGGGTGAALDKRGINIAFESRGDLTNGGRFPGPQLIYILAKDGNLHQITRGPNDARHPSITYSGSLIAYEWDGAQSTGPSVSQIFTAFFRPGRRIVFTQISNAGIPSISPSLSLNGRRLTFLSQDTSGAFQVFQWFKHHGVTQYTNVPEGVGSATSSVFIISALVTAADLKSSGNTSPQLFVLNPFSGAPPDFKTPFPGTPTPIPQTSPGAGGSGMTLTMLSRAADNGDGTVTGILDAMLLDSTGNPVPDGTAVHFTVGLLPADTITVTDGTTDTLPPCNVTAFNASTGITIVAQPGVAHSCVTYPKSLAGKERNFSASATTAAGSMSASAPFFLHGGGFPTPTPTKTPIPTRSKTPTPTKPPTPKKT